MTPGRFDIVPSQFHRMGILFMLQDIFRWCQVMEIRMLKKGFQLHLLFGEDLMIL